MTTNEIIKEIAVYDGYTHKEAETDGYFVREEYQEGYEYIFTYIDLGAYLTDLNILHRVAVKVWGKLIGSDIEDRAELRKSLELIENSFMYPPNEQGEYTHFATATAEAIIYLKSIKNSNTYLQ